MIEKVNPSHPDKIADRIAGAIVDLAYATEDNPRIAVEVLIGHGVCHIIAESSININKNNVNEIVKRIAGNVDTDLVVVPQDIHLSNNQHGTMRCGDNRIFKGVPITEEQKILSFIVRDLYKKYPTVRLRETSLINLVDLKNLQNGDCFNGDFKKMGYAKQ
ncbi:MAG: S-adenosylmethionine synthetase N-terminal domain-containing protein [Erysipelotrichaceae bacterium]|nr:S-adenosylmethionine synthetase N-terminal domain-containing protein [Erysipelotrichaceae bacterium]